VTEASDVSAPTVAVVVVAAGSGTRLQHAHPKAFVPVGDRTVLEHCLRGVFATAEPAQVVVVVPASRSGEAAEVCARAAGAAAPYLSVVVGGATRQQSVAAGLARLADGIETVLVHDAARAFTPAAQFELVVDAVRATGGGVVPGLPVTDTIKRTDGGRVAGTVDRSSLLAVQTPQGFPRADLEAAYSAAIEEHTDDAALFAAAGHAVTPITGDPLAFKITTPWDLRRAEGLAEELRPSLARTGVGIDVHAADPSRPLWLGGLHWPGEAGLAGHSDGDAVSHAVADALLSAAGLGDLGSRFGVDDPRFAEAHGDVFVAGAVDLLRGAGFAVGNAAVQVIARRPRIAGRRAEIEEHLTALVGAPVSVSATTTDGLGFTGRGEGVAVICTALVTRAG